MFPENFSRRVAVFTLAAGTLTFANYPNRIDAAPLHKDELLIHYLFDEGSGEVAVDSSGNSMDGVIVGAPEWVAGKFGQALDLATGAALRSNDAAGQHIQIPEIAFGGEVSVSMWINRDVQTQWARLFEFSNGLNNSPFLVAMENTSNNLFFRLWDTSVGNRDLRGVNLFEDETWDHFAVTVNADGNGSSRMEVFKNGVSVGNLNNASPVPAPVRTINYIGRSTGNDQYADMQVDDFRLYDIALTPAEVAIIANELEDSPVITPPVITLNGDETIYLTAGDTFTDPGVVAKDVNDADLTPVVTFEHVIASENLVARWALDGDLMDSSGNQNDGVHVNTADTNLDGAGINGNGLALDGVNQTIRIPHSETLKPSEAITISAWIKPTDLTTNEYYEIYRKEDGDDRHLLSFQGNGTILAFGLKAGDAYTEMDYTIDPVDFTDGEWHLVTAVYAEGLMEIYVDGVSAMNQVAVGTPGVAGTANAFIGSNNGNNEFFNGIIDDVRIYSIGLSAEQVLAMWNDGKSEVEADSIDTSTPGIWSVVYTATDTNAVSSTLKRKVIIVDAETPILSLNGDDPIILEAGTPLVDPGATAKDGQGTVLDADVKGTPFIVDHWHDQSGNGNHLTQLSEDSTPVYDSSGFNDKPTLIFQGTDELSNPYVKEIHSFKDFTYIAVHEFDDPLTPNWNTIVGIQDINSANGLVLLQRMNDNDQIGMHHAGRNGNARVKVDVLYGPRVSILSRAGGLGKGLDAEVTVSSNGIVSTGTQTWSAEVSTSRLQVAGRQQTSTTYFSGKISEIIVLGAGLSTEDREKAEGHLAHKWGLEGDLPVDHPYLDASPDQWTPADLPSIAGWYDATNVSNESVSKEFTLKYNYTNGSDIAAYPITRTVVVEDTTPPTISLVGEDTIKVRTGNPFVDPGAVAEDSFDGPLIVSSTEIAWNQLQAQGYHLSGRDNAWVNLDFNGGLMDLEPLGDPVPFASGPFGIGMHVDGDQFWHQLGTGINRNDDYQVLFTGVFRPLQDGNYRLGVDWPDDRASVWIDLDQDGRFEINGDDGNEWMNEGPQYGYSTVTLAAGEVYDAAISYLDFAGGARIISYIDIPGLLRQTINPADPEQAGYWGTRNPVDVNTPGTYTITYTASDRAGNEVTTTRTVIVDDFPQAPTITLQGGEHIRHAIEDPYVDLGVLIEDSEGNEIQGATPTIGGTLDESRPGFYTVTYDYEHDTDGAADTVVRFVEIFDNKPPTITLEGGNEIEVILGTPFVEPGVTVTDNSGETLQFVSTADIPRTGLQLHVDATYLEQFFAPGDVVSEWTDLSGQNRHMNDVRGEPTFSLDGINGSPSVHFDAEDFMATGYHHGSRLYTAIVLAQYDGGTMGRLISSRDNINWLMGFHNAYENVAHLEGWVTDTVVHPTRPITENPHVFIASNTGASQSRFYSDGVDYTYNAAPNGRPGRLQFGGYREVNEPGSGFVSEAILYNRVITEIERLGLELYLNTKYGINGHERMATLDTNKLGSYEVTYLAMDSSGNLTTVERVVNVVPDSSLPVVELNGDAITLHEFGEPFVDPQAVAKSPAGVELQTSIDGVGTVDVNQLGVYSLTYDFTDTEGNVAQTVTRQVIVEDTEGPIMSLIGDEVVRVEVGVEYIDEGATASDAREGELTAIPLSSKPGLGYVPGLLAGGLPGNPSTAPNDGSYGVDPLGPTISEINTNSSYPWAGNFTIIYTGQVYDEDGKISFTENIDDKVRLSVGGQQLLSNDGWNQRSSKTHDFGEGGWFDFELRMSNGGGGAGVAGGIGFGYDPEGGTNWVLPRNSDANTKDLFRTVSFDHNSVDTSELGNYSITFTGTDDLGNAASITRTVIVVEDTSQPFIGLVGEAIVEHEAGTDYTDPGAKGYAGDGSVLEENLVATGTVDSSATGTYELTYDFTDGNDNVAETVTRVVNVVDTLPPEITLNEFDGQTKFVRLFQNQEYSDPGAISHDLLDGDMTTFTDLGDVPNALNFSGFYANFAEEYLFFDQPGSLLDRTPRGSQLVRDPFHYSGDAGFRNAFPKIIARNDQFQGLWYGTFTAKRTGEYEFQLSNVDDRGTIWIDLDNDGLFSHEGELGDEQLNWGNSISRLIIEKGTYLFAMGHMEGGGGSGIRARFRTPEDAGPFDMTNIDPSSPEQDGIWTRLASEPVDTSILGRNLVRYYSIDAAGNFTMAERVIVVEIDKEKPVIALLGDPLIKQEAGDPYYDPGALLYDYQGNELDEALIIATNVPDGFKAGEFVIEYNYTDEGGHVADTVTRTVRLSDTIAPDITLIGVNPVTIPTGTAYVDPGARATDIVDGNLLVSSNLTLPLNGLTAWYTFDDGAGTETLTDATENNHAALHNFTGSEWVAEGKVNGALHFNPNGENNQYAHAPPFEIEGEFSVSAWVKYDSFQNWSRIIDFGNGANNNNILLANQGGGATVHWGIRQGGAESSIRVGNFWEQDVWVHVVGTVDSNNRMDVYKNGQLAGTQINGRQALAFSRTHQYIGRSNWGGDRYFHGMMDELMLYNRALTEQDIEQIYNGVEPMDTSVAGVHEVTYTVTDSSGNTSTAKRTVNIVDTPQIPSITLNGEFEMEVAASPDDFVDPGYVIKDANGVEIQGAKAVVTGEVDISKPGSYTLVYDYTDAQDNSAPSAVRNITVVDQAAPVITLVGAETIEHQLGNEWIDPGFSAEDFVEGEITVSTSEYTPNAILHSSYMMDAVPETILNFDQNAGLITLPSEGSTLLSRGPRNEGVHFDNNAQFRSSNPFITRDDNFLNLFTGHFNSKVAGIYEFGIQGEDDRAVFWMDLDQDGIFEIEGDNGNEWINGHYAWNFRQVELDVGYYAFAIGHIQYGGGSNLDVRWHTISGFGPRQRTFVNPSAGNQDGLWIQYNPVNVKKRGTYTITYTATDSVGNSATATRTVIVDSNPDAPVITLNGEDEIIHPYGQPFTDPMAVVKDVDGNVLEAALEASSGTVDVERPGEYELAYTFVDQNGLAAKTVYLRVTVADTTAPVITLIGDTEINHFVGTPFIDPGATALDDFDGELRVASSEHFTTDGLVLHLDTANIPGAEGGDPVMEWLDLSPAQNHVVDVKGTPIYTEDGIHGFPGVEFDGASSMAAPNDVGNAYTVFTVSKLTGTRNGRLFSSTTHNLILGYWNNRDDVYHPNAWVTLHDLPATTDSHLYIHSSTGRSNSRFWSEKGELTMYPAQGNGAIGRFQMGALQNLREPAAGVVSEVLVYDRFLKSYERLSLQSRLSVKYGFTEVPDATLPVNRDVIGDYVILYSVEDSNGNVSTTQRTVHVIADPDAPIITLSGEEVHHHELATDFTDPGFTLTNAAGDDLGIEKVVIVGEVDGDKPGTYKLTYNYTDANGKTAPEKIRFVQVSDTLPPEITLAGDAVIKLKVGTPYIESGFTAEDLAEGPVDASSNLEWISNQLFVSGFMEGGRDNNQLNFDNNGGLLALPPVGTNFFSGNIVGINGDAAFQEIIPEITRNDDYQLVFEGYFKAGTDGDYEFGIDNADDRCAFWIDLDQDDIFDATGDNGSEVVFTNYNGGGWKTYTLTEGFYKVAIGFMEHGGGAWVRPRVRLPNTGGRTPVHPGNPALPNLWFVKQAPDFVDINTPGTYTIDYTASDSLGNVGTVQRTIIVVEDDTLPLITLNGEDSITSELGEAFEDPGATVIAGNGETLETNHPGAGTVDVNALGQYTVTYTYTDTGGKEALPLVREVEVIDTTGPSITLLDDGSGNIETLEFVVGEDILIPGVTATDLSTAEPFTWTSLDIPSEGLVSIFRFDENEGDVAYDHWGGHHAKLINMDDNAHIPGKIDLGIYLNGAEQYLEIEPFEFGGAMSFALWISYENFNNWSRVISFNDGQNNNQIFLANEGGGTDLIFDVRRGGGRQFLEIPQFWNNFGWVHITSTVSETGYFKLYENGELVAEKAGHLPTLTTRKNHHIGKSAWPDGYFQGMLDQFLIYSRELTASEIKALAEETALTIDNTRDGTYTVEHFAVDDFGNTSSAERTIIVQPDPAAPLLTLNSEEILTHEAGTAFIDPGATAKDKDGNDLENNVQGAISLTVSHWMDQSGNSNHLKQASIEASPTLEPEGFLGKPTLQFDGLDTLVHPSIIGADSRSDLTYIAVHDLKDPQAGNWTTIVGIQNVDSALGCMLLQQMDVAQQIGMHRAGRDGNRRVKLDVLYGPRVTILSRTGGNSTGNEGIITIASNGVVATGTQTWDTEIATSRLQVGGHQQNGTGYLNGKISEIIVLGAGISEEDRLSVEGHLAHKWGIADQLPVDHPHLDQAPDQWTPQNLASLAAWYDANNISGETTSGLIHIEYNYTTTEGKVAIPISRTIQIEDTTAPEMNLVGDNPVTIQLGSDYIDPGVTIVDSLDGELLPNSVSNSNPYKEYVPGLLYGNLPGNNAHNDIRINPGNLGDDPIGPSQSEITTRPPWITNYTFYYSGEIYDEDGIISFYERVRDRVRLSVGTNFSVLSNADPNQATERTLDLREGGWFPFELKMSVGGGAPGKNGDLGFGYDPEGGTEYVHPANSAETTADLFRYLKTYNNKVRTDEEGEFTLTYTAVDATGNEATITRTILVKDDPSLPVLTFMQESDAEITIEAGTTWEDPGYQIHDRRGEIIDGTATITGSVDTSTLGTYTLYYDFELQPGKSAPQIKRMVTVVDTTAPTIELIGGTPFAVKVGETFTDPGATVTDNLDTGLTTEGVLRLDISNIVAHWSFDEGTGLVAEDTIGGLDGTLVNFTNPDPDADPDAHWVDGKHGKAIQFDGLSNYITIPATEKLDLQKFTISFWMKSLDYSQSMFVFEKTADNTLNSQYNVFLDAEEFYFRVIDANTSTINEAKFVTTDELTNSEWHHVTAVYDGTNQNVYLDAELVATQPQTETLVENPNGPSYIGAFAPGNGYFFNGILDDIRIYNDAVHQDLIPSLQNVLGIDTSKVNLTPYILDYTVTDSSGNTTTVQREVVVSNDENPPVLTLAGQAVVTIQVGDTYNDEGAIAYDEEEDRVLSSFIVRTGTVDTQTPGTYTLTYNVKDSSGNSAIPVSRTVIVEEGNTFEAWVASTPLSSLDPTLQDPEADPDSDGHKNLLEYALGTEPTVGDSSKHLSAAKTDTGHLIIQYVRRKTLDTKVTIKAQLTTNLTAPNSWDENALTESLDTDQSGLTAEFERIQVKANTPIANEPQSQQFIRILVEKSN